MEKIIADCLPMGANQIQAKLSNGNRPDCRVRMPNGQPSLVIDAIHGAGGLASFAHPGVTKRDDLIAPLVDRGLDAIEVYHSDHSPETQAVYQRMAKRLNVLMSGGSDFHGEESAFARATAGRSGTGARPQRNVLGVVTLPPADFAALENRRTQ